MIAKTLVSFTFAAACMVTLSSAWACSSHEKMASTPITPVQTAEAPKSTKTK